MNLPGLPAVKPAGRILDLDIENRPLSYWYDGQCTAEITAIAWAWVGSRKVQASVLGEVESAWSGRPTTVSNMLYDFHCAYDEADMVTGHYLRKHDLPIINAGLIELGMEPLGPKLVSDTKLDLVRFGGLPKSQEALGAMLHLRHPKVQMTQAMWRDANRLTPEGIKLTRKRVVGDVRQHMQLRAALVGEGLLKPPFMWRPGWEVSA